MATPKADTVQWMGLCPCGCGSYYAVLLTEKEQPIGTFGWDRNGWMEFMAGVHKMIGDPDQRLPEETLQ